MVTQTLTPVAPVANPATNGPADLWPQLAPLRLQLSPNLSLHRHVYRGQSWVVIADAAHGGAFRCPAEVGALLELLDGSRSLEEAVQVLAVTRQGDAPAPEEIVALIAQLLDADLVQGEVPLAHARRLSRRDESRQRRRRQQWARPLMIKLPLWDPDPLLRRLQPLLAPLFTPTAALIWCAVVGLALFRCAEQWPALTWYWSARFLDPVNLALLLLLYPLLKALHELGHGAATRHWGGGVHETGIMLLVFVPLPYVDASASCAFADKRQRMLVAGAGIAVEGFVAALGILAWGALDPGPARDIAFDLAVLGGISTLLFNGNPLLRFDAYYALADWLEIPNLGSRSNRYLGYLFKRYALGLRAASNPVTAAGEAPWLVLYGAASGIYRLCISLGIALFVAGKYFIFGLLLGLWLVLSQLIWPALRHLVLIGRAARGEGRLGRLLGILGAVVSIVWLGLFTLPLNSSVTAQGLLDIDEDTCLRTGTEGFFARFEARPGTEVSPGQALIRLDNPDLRARHAQLQARREELATRRSQALLTDPTEAANLLSHLEALDAQLADLGRQVEQLVLRSPRAGVFAVDHPEDMPGRFYAKGDQLAWVIDRDLATATVVVPARHALMQRRDIQRVEVRVHSRPDRVLQGQSWQQRPAATHKLPHPALGSAGGGAIPVDSNDEQRLTTMQAVFVVEVALPAVGERDLRGGRVTVRFITSGQTLYERIRHSLGYLALTRLKI